MRLLKEEKTVFIIRVKPKHISMKAKVLKKYHQLKGYRKCIAYNLPSNVISTKETIFQ